MQNELIYNKKLKRYKKGLCINCGNKICKCAISKLLARKKILPQGIKRFK